MFKAMEDMLKEHAFEINAGGDKTPTELFDLPVSEHRSLWTAAVAL